MILSTYNGHLIGPPVQQRRSYLESMCSTTVRRLHRVADLDLGTTLGLDLVRHLK